MDMQPYSIVDVFAEQKYAGNQLAVVREAEGLSTTEMQQIAREMHFSETTFIPSDQPRDGGYDVRIFTPETELPFAGHPTLGTAFVIQQEIIKSPVERVVLNLKVGQIPVTFSYNGNAPDVLWMRQVPPEFGGIVEPETMAQTLSIDTGEIDARFPIQQVSTGIPFLMVPLKHLSVVRNLKPNWELFAQRTTGAFPQAMLVFCPETESGENQLHARGFTHAYGIEEDPATGSANGCLAGYLARYRYFGSSSVEARVEQGYEIHRPSILYLRSGDKKGAIEVNVGGKAVLVARGELV